MISSEPAHRRWVGIVRNGSPLPARAIVSRFFQKMIGSRFPRIQTSVYGLTITQTSSRCFDGDISVAAPFVDSLRDCFHFFLGASYDRFNVDPRKPPTAKSRS